MCRLPLSQHAVAGAENGSKVLIRGCCLYMRTTCILQQDLGLLEST